MEQNYIEEKIMTVYHNGNEYNLIHSRWEWNGEKYEHFDLMFGHHVGHWNYCPLYREMIEVIEDMENNENGD